MSLSFSSTTSDSADASTVALLPLVLIPIVISGFLLVYALVGGVLEGDSLQRWLDEAWSVALPTGLVQALCCLCIVAYVRHRGMPWNHMYIWLSALNTALAAVLVALVYIWSH